MIFCMYNKNSFTHVWGFILETKQKTILFSCQTAATWVSSSCPLSACPESWVCGPATYGRPCGHTPPCHLSLCLPHPQSHLPLHLHFPHPAEIAAKICSQKFYYYRLLEIFYEFKSILFIKSVNLLFIFLIV